jgi:hypothetical protein
MFRMKLPLLKPNSPLIDSNFTKPKAELFSQIFTNSIALEPRDVRIRIPF